MKPTNVEIKWKEHQNALKRTEKSFRRWFLYTLTGILPVLLSSAVIAYCLYNQYRIRTELSKTDYIVRCVPIFALLIVLEVIACFITGKNYYRLNDSVSSIFQGIAQLILVTVIKSSVVIPYCYINENYGLFKTSESYYWSLWIGTFLAIDYGYYWFHRFAHEWNAMWAGHIAHHSSEEYNFTTALRQGVWQPLVSWMFHVPFAFIFPIDLFIFHTQWNTIYQFWIHTRFVKKLPAPIEFIFNTPSHHRVHHGRNPQYIDKNYGGTLIIYDRIFGTFQPEEEEVVYGITHPPNRWNIFWVQIHHFVEMWKTATTVPGILNKLRVFLDFGPGFNFEVLYPEEVKNPVKITPKTQMKYDSKMPNTVMSVYGFVHASALIAISSLFADYYKSNTNTVNVMNASYLIITMITIGCLFENARWTKWGEIGRIFFGFSLLIFHLSPQFWKNPNLNDLLVLFNTSDLLIVAAVVAILSTITILFMYRPTDKFKTA